MDISDEAWVQELGRRVRLARDRERMTQMTLASRAGISKVWISRIERGKVARPGAQVLDQIANVLGGDVIPPFRVAQYDEGKPVYNVIGRVDDEALRGREARLLPVYRWGSAGDPRNAESSPDPDHEEYPPLGKETLIGVLGFGVLVRGESMGARGIHDGDVVWINPERSYRVGRPVLARLWNADGECGMVIKTLRREPDDSLALYSDTIDGSHISGIQYTRYEIIGPVVGISPAFKLPE